MDRARPIAAPQVVVTVGSFVGVGLRGGQGPIAL